MIRIEITKAGSRALERGDRAVDGVEREMLAGLDSDEAAGLWAALQLCGRALEPDVAPR